MTDTSLDPDTLRSLAFPDALDRLGGLHDCTVTRAEWEPAAGSLRLDIEDMFWNAEGFPECSGAIELEGIPCSTGLGDFLVPRIWLLDVSARAVGEGYAVSIGANVGPRNDYQHVTIACRHARLVFGER